MASSDYDLIENPTPRCACMLVLDTSLSMNGEPIQELNEGVQQFLQAVKDDDFASNAVELGIITFGDTVREVVALQSVEQLSVPSLVANGNTPMGQAVIRALEVLEARKQSYKQAGVSYYQPWLVLMSDGGPTDAYQMAAARLKQLGNEKKVLMFAVGIGAKADLTRLSEFCPDNRPPKRLQGLKFAEFFSWLSQSMARVSASTPGMNVTLPPSGGWESITV